MEENVKETVVEETVETPAEEKLSFKDKRKKKKENEILKEENEALKKEVDALKAELDASQNELAKTKNAYFKAYADTENLKKRLQAEHDTLRKYRIQSFAAEILPVIDNLERAISVEAKDEEMQNHINGIQMIYQQLMTALDREGVKVIEAKDKPFDPKVHQALLMEKVEGVESNMVLEEIQKGYMLKDRVLRATLVKVSE